MSETPPFAGILKLNVAGLLPLTVNVTAVVVPADVVIVTFRAPTTALASTMKVAVIVVELTSATEDAVTPEPLTTSVMELSKFVPVNVMGIAVPR